MVEDFTAKAAKLGLTIDVTESTEVSPLQGKIKAKAAAALEGRPRGSKHNQWDNESMTNALFEYFAEDITFREENKEAIRNHQRRSGERPEMQWYAKEYKVPNASFCTYVKDAEYISTQSILPFPWAKEVFLDFVEMRKRNALPCRPFAGASSFSLYLANCSFSFSLSASIYLSIYYIFIYSAHTHTHTHE